MELKGCTAIVTGGSGGLGQRICHALARNGVNVVVNYAASESKAKGVADELMNHGVKALAIKADVTDVAAVNRMVEQTQKAFDERQREHVLREQMRQIQKELGESGDNAAELEELRKALDAAGIESALVRVQR
mgnify:CR=1 FL=1